MISKKTISVLIICLSVVTSVFIYTKNTKSLNSEQNQVVTISKTSPRSAIETSDDWKKILVTANTDAIDSVLPKETGDDVFDGTSITANMARDFLSQYLVLKEGGRDLSQEEKDQIAQNISSSPVYVQTKGAVYIASNLKINTKENQTDLKTYRATMNAILKNRSTQIENGPVSIIGNALKSDQASILDRLDPIILTGKGFVDDLLAISVPKSATNVHLALLNSVSNLLYDVQLMRKSFTDPAGSLAGISGYNKHLVEFQNSLAGLNAYFVAKLGSTR